MECREHNKTTKLSLLFQVLENLPLIIVIIFGILITTQLWWVFGVLYGFYSIIGLILFMKHICPYCSHYRHKTCPAGFHIITTRFFFPKDGKVYNNQYKRFIPVVYPIWFAPLPAALYLLFISHSVIIILYLFIFCLVGFIILPLVSKNQCRKCKNAPYCPRRNKQTKKLNKIIPNEPE